MFFVALGIGVACLPVLLILVVLAKWFKIPKKKIFVAEPYDPEVHEPKDPGFGTDFQALSVGKVRNPDGSLPKDDRRDDFPIPFPGSSAVSEGRTDSIDVPVVVPDHIMDAVREVMGYSSVEELTEEYLKLGLQDLETHVLAATNAYMAAAGTVLTNKDRKAGQWPENARRSSTSLQEVLVPKASDPLNKEKVKTVQYLIDGVKSDGLTIKKIERIKELVEEVDKPIAIQATVSPEAFEKAKKDINELAAASVKAFGSTVFKYDKPTEEDVALHKASLKDEIAKRVIVPAKKVRKPRKVKEASEPAKKPRKKPAKKA